jgi:hypothetical protein
LLDLADKAPLLAARSLLEGGDSSLQSSRLRLEGFRTDFPFIDRYTLHLNSHEENLSAYRFSPLQTDGYFESFSMRGIRARKSYLD